MKVTIKQVLEEIKAVRKLLEDKQISKPNKPTLIDLDGAPLIPKEWQGKGWQILPEDQLPNVVKGQLDPTKITLYLSKEQEGDKWIEGNKLREELKTQPVFSANLLDWLLKPENQHLIPSEWKGKVVFFWGTIYRVPDGILYVRYLCWHGVGWSWNFSWLDGVWDSDFPAAVSAS